MENCESTGAAEFRTALRFSETNFNLKIALHAAVASQKDFFNKRLDEISLSIKLSVAYI